MRDTTFYRDLMEENRTALYDAVWYGLKNRLERIHIPFTPTLLVNTAISSVLKDHPELVWTNGRWRGQFGETSVIMPEYTLSDAEICAFQNELILMNEALDDVLVLPEQDRVRWAYDYILENVVYDLTAPHSQDAYGALVDGRAVCRGIARGLQLLLQACGIETITVEGRLCEEVPHVWNVVSFLGGCYHLDLTMGYPMFSFQYTQRGLPYDKYAAFCVSDETLRKTHEWDVESLPIRCPRSLYE